jgi:prevent-host-death family protein
MKSRKPQAPRLNTRPKTLEPTLELQAAKSHFTELFHMACNKGPQFVTDQGKEMVVVVALEEFEKLMGRTRQPQSLVEFFARSPLAKAKINLDREDR